MIWSKLWRRYLKSNLLSETRSGVQQHLCGGRGTSASPKWWSDWFWDNWYKMLEFIVEHINLDLHSVFDVNLHRVWFGTFFKDVLSYCWELPKTAFGLSGTVSGGDWKRFTFFYGPTNLETCLPGFSEFNWKERPTNLEICLLGFYISFFLNVIEYKCTSN